MFARVARYEIPTESVGAARETFRQAINEIQEAGGLAEAFLLMDADSGRVVTITLWESRVAMEASHVTASRLRIEAARAHGGSVISSEEFEVTARERGRPS